MEFPRVRRAAKRKNPAAFDVMWTRSAARCHAAPAAQMDAMILQWLDFCHATQRNATQRNAMQRNATQRNATQRNATQRNATQRNATQRNATQRNATQRNATQRNATQRNATQRNATREKTRQWKGVNGKASFLENQVDQLFVTFNTSVLRLHAEQVYNYSKFGVNPTSEKQHCRLFFALIARRRGYQHCH